MIDYSFRDTITQIIATIQKMNNDKQCFQEIATWIIANYNYALQLYSIELTLGLVNIEKDLKLKKKDTELKLNIDGTCSDFNRFSSNSTINAQISQVCTKYSGG